METIEKTIDVDRSLRSVYNQWTQFEDFPQFMEGVKSVQQLDDKRLHWEAEIAGKRKSWDAEIFEQVPDSRIAWRSTTGAKNTGMVNFEAIDPGHTRVSMKLNYEPEGAAEKVGDMLGIVSARVSGDLKRFKEFIENRETPPEGWRGEIEGRQVHPEGKPPRHESGV
jgi:uncharacterized membrane protein